MSHDDPWLDIDENGKGYYRAPTWRERFHRTIVNGDHIGIFFTVACIALFLTSIRGAHASEAKAAAAMDEARTIVLARLDEAGVPPFEGNYCVQLTTFTDNFHPSDPTFQIFEIVGADLTEGAETYYLVDRDGYISTLTFQHGIPIWRPDGSPTEPNLNPKYERSAHYYLNGDFSVRFISTDSTNSNES